MPFPPIRPPGRGFSSMRRRQPIGVWSFLRPPRRHEEDQQLFLQRLRDEPNLRREHRASLAVQLVVVGALLVACVAFFVQTAVLVRRLNVPALSALGWFIPAVVGCFALMVLRRFLRLLSDYRSMRDD